MTDIGLQYNPGTKSVLIVVLAQIDLEPHRTVGESHHGLFTGLIRQGLKAQLQYQTSLRALLVDLDFHPGKPVRLVRSNLAYPQIPTVPSSSSE